MQVVYTGEEMPEKFSKSIFLAGPSLRPGQEKEFSSWRKDALQILEDIGFDGVVFCPENRDFKFPENFSYDDQIDWEDKYLNLSDCILFWVPRDLSLDESGKMKLPAFTTNVEFGAWIDSGKVVFGAPPDADKNNYLKYYADKYKVEVAESLTETIENALEKIKHGVEREGGERYVPLFVWNTSSFQSWYKSQLDAGNSLEYAKLLYTFRPQYKSFVFLWVLQVAIYVADEDRVKDNEFVLARPDISSVLLWKKGDWMDISEIILIKEFRSPANTSDGFIRELPGGSATNSDSDLDIAAEEVFEETGFHLDPSRLVFHQARQLASTLSSHKAHFYSVELTAEEMDWFKSQKDISHGKKEDTEVTWIETTTIQDVVNNPNIDWSSVGMILSAVYQL